MIDIFKDAVVAGVPLVLFVMGLVQFIKSFGLSGCVVKLLSLAVGILLGVGYQLATVPPVGWAGWFSAGIFGIALGLVASGFYEVVNPPAAKP